MVTYNTDLTLLHSEWPKLYGVLAILSAKGLSMESNEMILKSFPIILMINNAIWTLNKASQAIQSPRTVPFFLLVSLLDGYSFPNVLVKGIVAFKH